MNCKELVYLLGDYFDGTMETRLREELGEHIQQCEPCMAFLRTYDTTRILSRTLRPEEIPAEVRDRLKAFVAEKAREHSRDIEKYTRRAAEERREQVLLLLRSYFDHSLSPTMEILFDSHREGCGKCGSYLQSIRVGKEITIVPPEIEEHIADFLDALPPGEIPVRP